MSLLHSSDLNRAALVVKPPEFLLSLSGQEQNVSIGIERGPPVKEARARVDTPSPVLMEALVVD